MARRDAPIESFAGPTRRFGARYRPVCRDARLAGGPEDLATQFALLLDISLTGASVLTDRFPRHDRPVWIRLEGEPRAGWSRARVVAVTSTRRGPHVVRLEFHEPCPREILRDVVSG